MESANAANFCMKILFVPFTESFNLMSISDTWDLGWWMFQNLDLPISNFNYNPTFNEHHLYHHHYSQNLMIIVQSSLSFLSSNSTNGFGSYLQRAAAVDGDVIFEDAHQSFDIMVVGCKLSQLYFIKVQFLLTCKKSFQK